MPGGTQEAAMADTPDNKTQDEWNEETAVRIHHDQ